MPKIVTITFDDMSEDEYVSLGRKIASHNTAVGMLVQASDAPIKHFTFPGDIRVYLKGFIEVVFEFCQEINYSTFRPTWATVAVTFEAFTDAENNVELGLTSM